MGMFGKTSVVIFVVLMLGFFCTSCSVSSEKHWVGTWATSQQLAEPHNTPPAPHLENNTLRHVVRVTLGGSRIRVQFSNKYSSQPFTINSAHIALSKGGSAIDTATDRALMFNGKPSVTIPAGGELYSDALDFKVSPLSALAVSIYFGSASSTNVTGHPGSRTDSYIKTGNAVSASFTPDGKKANWWIVSGIDLWLDDSYGCVAVLGDSITDGRGSTTNGNNRWPDCFAKRLQANPDTAKVGVLNHGIGGNAIVKGGLGPTALARFDHDVIEQPGVRWVIIFEGVNDIGGGQSADSIISAYKTFITKAHNAGLLIYGATITPFKGNGYYSTEHEAVRDAVNDWIRTGGEFDGVIDFDMALRDPADEDQLDPAYQFEWLHFNPAGYQAMADSIDLNLFR